jgi:hypothetical protein
LLIERVIKKEVKADKENIRRDQGDLLDVGIGKERRTAAFRNTGRT